MTLDANPTTRSEGNGDETNLDTPAITKEKIDAVQNGRHAEVTVEEITAIHTQHLAELGSKSDGTLPKDLATPPGFLLTVFNWIMETANCRQPLFALSASLVLLGTIFGQKVKSSLGLYTNIFAMNVGRSSSGKDHPLHAVLKALDDSGASHLWRSKVTSDSAIEAALDDNSNLLLTVDEAGHFFRAANARGNRGNPSNSIKPALLELWSSAGKLWKGKQRARCNGKPQEVVVIENPHVCFYGGTQPEIFFDGISTEDIRDGWIPRNLLFYTLNQMKPEIKRHTETPVEIVDVIKWWTGEDREKRVRDPYVIELTDDANEKLRAFSDEVFKMTSGESASAILYGKVIENSIRISTISAVARHIKDPENAVIDLGDIDYAFNLVKYLSMTMEDVLKLNLAENYQERLNKRVLKIIKSAGKGGITTSALTGKSRWISSQARRKILDDLIMSGDICEQPTQKGGYRFTALKTDLTKKPSKPK